MTLPNSNLTIRDGGLGILQPTGENTLAVIGLASSGTANQPTTVGNAQTLQSVFGSGNLVEAAAFVMATTGKPVVCVKATATNGSNGSVTHTGTGLSVMSVSGNPLDSYEVKALVIVGDVQPQTGKVVIQVSLDGGLTYGPQVAVSTSGTYVIPNTGLTLTFSGTAGAPLSVVVGDTYAFSATGPTYTTSDFNAAMDALLADTSKTWFAALAAGVPADSTATQAIFGAADSKMSTAEGAYRYGYVIMNAHDDTDANLITATAALASKRVNCCGGFARITSAISGSEFKRPISWLSAARAAAIPPKEDEGKVASGPVKGVVSLFRDETNTPALSDARFTTMRTFPGYPGFYITNGRIMSSPGSDYQYTPNRRVMDIASAVVRQGQLYYVNAEFVVDAVTGHIRELDAQEIEARIGGMLNAALMSKQYASDVQVVVDRSNNILSTQAINITYRIVPLGYGRAINGDISFLNPALIPV